LSLPFCFAFKFVPDKWIPELGKKQKRPDDKKGATIMSLRRSFRDASIRAKYYGLFGD